jgi:hypothetical protein
MTPILPRQLALLFFVLVLIGIAVAQYLICAKSRNKFIGLIIPIIAFIGGLFVALVVQFSPMETAELIRQILVCQIPALVYLAIFVIILITKKVPAKEAKQEIKKMNIQDL